MKSLQIIAIFVVALAGILYVVVGHKNHYNKFYEFTNVIESKNGTKIVCRLLGTYQYNNNETIFTNPYEVFISMTANQKCEALKLSIVNLSSGDTILSREKLIHSEVVTSKDTIKSYYSFKNTVVPHSDMRLKLIFSCNNSIDTIDATFKARYRFYKSNKFLDILSGV